jgi:hypothetical protein
MTKKEKQAVLVFERKIFRRIHSSVICHTTGPQPLPKRLFLERDSAGKVIMW